jgi:NAD-dependent deacetylase
MGSADSELELARRLVAGAQHLVALTGAGISTASGIPDFRGPDGVWTKDPDAEMLSSYDRYVASPEVRIRAWKSRLNSPTWDAQPNAAHRSLVELERRDILELIITQNVDRLHHKAGQDPARIIEIHGNAHEALCLRCGALRPIAEVLERLRGGEEDPHCTALHQGSSCGGILKSATVSFGQSLVAQDLSRAEAAARRCDVMVAIGSTLSVYPIAGVVPLARRSGASIIIINAEPTAMDELADVLVRGEITAVLSDLLR